LLLERGADVSALNIECQIPLQVLPTHGYREIADLPREHDSGGR